MSAPRKPTEILELNGSFKINPNRRRPVGPRGDGELGEPPDSLSLHAATCWKEIESNAAQGVLTSSDRMIMEIAAILMAKMRAEGLTAAETTQYIKSLSLMGMTPADRSRISVGKQEEESPFSEFIQ